jgi:hypothetical protein
MLFAFRNPIVATIKAFAPWNLAMSAKGVPEFFIYQLRRNSLPNDCLPERSDLMWSR